MIAVTPIYAALVALIFIALSAQVIRYRRANGVSVGDAGDPRLLQLMRVHANCAEYAPIAILLLLMAELQGWPPIALHIAGIMLVLSRAAHGYGLSQRKHVNKFRIWGMILVLTQITFTAIGLIGVALLG